MTDIQLAQIIWEYVRCEHPLEKADVIIGLGSHDLQTAKWCAKLYNDGWAPSIVFCGGRGRLTEDLVGQEADRYAEVALKMGVPETAIMRDVSSTNTGENIVNAYRILHDREITPSKIILVTKPYMLRRAYATFMKQWPDSTKPQVICSAIDKNLEEYGEGIESLRDTIGIMVGDLQRIREYPKIGFQVEQHIPDEIWLAGKELIARGYDEHSL